MTISLARAGDLEALEALYRAFETPVYNVALRMLRTPEDAEDVLQETFLEVVRSIKQYRGEGHLWGWIKRIAASKALMRIRRNHVRATEELDEESTGRQVAYAGPEHTRSGSVAGVPARIDLERAFEQLSETSRSVVRDALRVEERRRRRRWGAWSLSAAAGIALLLLIRPGPGGRVDAAELERMKQQSATLEAELERYDPAARVTSGRTAALAAALEDRIAVIDGELAQVGTPEAPVRRAELVKLWQQRVDAMQQLMTVHVTRAAYVGL